MHRKEHWRGILIQIANSKIQDGPTKFSLVGGPDSGPLDSKLNFPQAPPVANRSNKYTHLHSCITGFSQTCA